MKKLMRRLWADDQGAIITTEWLLISAVLLMGLVPALVGFRNQLAATLLTIGNTIHSTVSLLAYDGYNVLGQTNTDIIATTPGYASTAPEFLTMNNTGTDAATVTAGIASGAYVSPAP